MYAKVVVLFCFIAVALADQKWHGPIAGGLPADLYPAGISPQACPNFPNCDNPAVALAATPHGAAAGGNGGGWNGGGHAGGWNGAGAGGWNGAGAGAGGWNGGHNNGGWNGAGAGAGGWNGAGAGGWNGGHSNDVWNNHQNPLDRGEYIGDGDYRGEGLDESGAYGNFYNHK